MTSQVHGPSAAGLLAEAMADAAAFGAWFGRSAVVDDRGAPRVVFHGTTSRFDAFRPHTTRGMQLGFGIHFSEERDLAEHYARNPKVARSGAHPRVVRALLSVQRPLLADRVISERDAEWELARKLAGRKTFGHPSGGVLHAYLQSVIDIPTPARAAAVLEAAGYDGVSYVSILRGTHEVTRSPAWVVFRGDQVRVLDPG